LKQERFISFAKKQGSILNQPKYTPFFTSVSWIFLALSALAALLGIFMILHGYPAPEWLPRCFGTKSVRKIYQLFLLLLALGVLALPNRARRLDQIFSFLKNCSAGPWAVTALLVFYSALFLWNQVTAYLALQVNFLPFSFYDYMLYYLSLGKVNFTGLLHWFYHANNILVVLFPLWLLVKSPLLLVVCHGPLLALAALPLFLASRRIFPDHWIPIAIAFFYLNFRFLLNLLEMDFLAESFYPLLILTAFYFLVARRRALFFCSLVFLLLVKEDAAFYVLSLGLFLLFFRTRRSYGLGAVVLALCYSFFLVKVFLPGTENAILVGSAKNYRQWGATPAEVVKTALAQPLAHLATLFWPAAKLKTQMKLLEMTFFVPLLTPWYLMVLVALFPCFAQGSDLYSNFTDIRFHYSAVVIPFLFIALASGLGNLNHLLRRSPWRENLLRLFFFLLVLVNGGHYLSHRIEAPRLETIRKIQEIPRAALLVTQGHLLPYAGYRTFNFYFSEPYERPSHPYHFIYQNADYYFVSRLAPSYPYGEDWAGGKIRELGKDPHLELVYDDGENALFKRKLEPYKPDRELWPLEFAHVQYEKHMREGGLL